MRPSASRIARPKTRRLSTAICFAACALFLSASTPSRHQATTEIHSELALDWSKLNGEALQKLADYIRVDTSNPPGNEMHAVEWYRKIFEAEGIAYKVGESAPGRGNIVARLKGKGTEAALVLLNHMDVVPVSREFWTVEPFAGVQRDRYLWGRGALDMKSTGVAELLAFLELHREKVPLRRDVIFLATADEEAGADFGTGWVVKNHPEWFAGAGFLLNEGSGSRLDDAGKPLFFGIGTVNKAPAWLKLTATGRSGHGSVPIPDSAVNRLIAALERLRVYDSPIEVTPPIERAFHSMAPYVPAPWGGRLAKIREYVKRPEARAELAKQPGYLALLTNTISITGLEGTQKINIIPPSATALVDCRLLPGWTAERWVAEIRRILQDDSIHVEVILNMAAPVGSPWDTPLEAAIEHAVKSLHPGAGVAEVPSTGFNDSYYFRSRGIVSYGFVPFALREEDAGREHGNDERIPVKSYTDGVRLLWEVVYNFLRAE